MYQQTKPIYLCAPKRSAIGSFGGVLSSLPAVELATKTVEAVLVEAGVSVEKVQGVILGCVLQAGQGQAPARQVLIKAGIPEQVQAMTINKVCSSGLKSVMLAANEIELGQAGAILAGGMESMSQAPYYMPSLRDGARLGHTSAQDSIIQDGLWDVYSNQHMGNCGELCAREKNISREDQDAFALESYKRAREAAESGALTAEIAPISVPSKRDEIIVKEDEEPTRLKAEKVPQLRPVFDKEGTITAANASSLNDGAAAMLVCSEKFVSDHGLKPMAKLVAQSWNATQPEWFTVAPVGAMQSLLEATSKTIDDIDLFEVNEAFSVVALACQRELNIPAEKLNIHGGAVALGHPIGASGARILTTLVHALHRNGKKRGIAAICNGGGEATAVMVETV